MSSNRLLKDGIGGFAHWLVVMLMTSIISTQTLSSEPPSHSPEPIKSPDYFAWVGNEKIALNEFQMAVQAGIRQRFYHGKVPQEQLLAYRQEVAQLLVDRALLLQEAQRQQIQINPDEVEKNIANYAARYANSDYWQKNQTNLLPGLRSAIEEENLLQHLEQKVKNTMSPSEHETQAFYHERAIDYFTTPERMRVSLIMLKVDPSAGAPVWEAAFVEAEAIIKRIRQGADFGDLARIHSGDKSANQGGDMGFIHEGMLAAPAQQAAVKLQVGEVTDPLVLLQGIAILQLDERHAPVLNKYEEVAARAKKLLQRARAEQAWETLILSLRREVNISINPALHLSLPL